MNIAIIGANDSGKATFLVLLYAAQIRYSELSAGEFRFYINPKSLKPVSAEYNRMQMGKWPSDKLVNDIPMVSFLYGRSDDSLGSRFMKMFGKSKIASTISLNFSLYDFSDAELKDVINSGTMSFYNITDKVESLLSSEMVVIILDASKLHQKKANPNDDYISYVLTNIARFRKKMIFPIVVFTKFDAVNRKLMASLKLPVRPPAMKHPEKRRAYGERLMAKYYQNTLQLMKKGKQINYESGLYFFSSVKTTTSSDGSTTPALKKGKEMKYILDCSYPEYIGFIEYLEKLVEDSENS
jgi:hypothetical protein